MNKALLRILRVLSLNNKMINSSVSFTESTDSSGGEGGGGPSTVFTHLIFERETRWHFHMKQR